MSRSAMVAAAALFLSCIVLRGNGSVSVVNGFTFTNHRSSSSSSRRQSSVTAKITTTPTARTDCRSYYYDHAGEHIIDHANNYETADNRLLLSRRSMMAMTAVTTVLLTTPATTRTAYAATKNGLPLTTAPVSGLQWTDAKIGSTSTTNDKETSVVPTLGSKVSIDYSMASTVGRFPTIYTTKDKGQPYAWTIGDGTTIQGIEIAILGNKEDKIPPMKPGGIRRVIIPNNLGYNQLISAANSKDGSPSDKNKRCIAGNDGSIGPIPPKDASDGTVFEIFSTIQKCLFEFRSIAYYFYFILNLFSPRQGSHLFRF